MSFDLDLFVIGGGSGGVRAARWSAMAGARVALAEEYRYGGTCVIRGCVPKKLMMYASAFPDAFEDARAFGWDVQAGGFDWAAFIARKDAELDRLETAYQGNLEKAGVSLHRSQAVIADAHTVRLANGTTLTARHILVATGGAPFRPDFPGAEHCITSNEIFHLAQRPDRILIVGGGYIACEFACIMNGLGSHVTQFYRGAQILRGFDDEVRGHLAEEMRADGIDLHVGRDVVAVERDGARLRVTCTDGTVTDFDAVLVATGRRPNTAGLGLTEVGVILDRAGAVVVDQWSQTVVPSIHAIGDVTNRLNLTPVAIRDGMALAETLFRGNPTSVDHALAPTAVFTRPEIGTVGLTQEQARDQGETIIYRSTFRPMQGAFAGRAQRMLMKLVVDAATRRVLGVHIVGPGAGEMIQLAGIAVKMGATKEDFDRTVAVHPTAAEEMVTMREGHPA
jgi:glutathione reductase (NADPH)